MWEKIAEDLFRIGVPLPGNPLKELNAYFIRGKERDLLIDTGFRREECREALRQSLEELGSRPERRDILLTHLHSDHAGLSREFVAEKGHVYLGKVDLERLTAYVTGQVMTKNYRAYERNGFSWDKLMEMDRVNPARRYMVEAVDERFVMLEDGAELCYGAYSLKAIEVPGHTPGNMMFWDEVHGIMFTGDHILFDISPNITMWDNMKDSLGSYMDSLRKVREYPVKLALPGHRSNGNYKERIDALLRHHESRLAEAKAVVAEKPGLTAFEIAGLMTWRIRSRSWEDFPLAQKWFAVGECIAHLEHLAQRGQLRNEEIDGLIRYYPV